MYPKNSKNIKEAYNYTTKYLEFKSIFLEKTLGKNMNFFRLNYMLYTHEVIEEFLEIWYKNPYK